MVRKVEHRPVPMGKVPKKKEAEPEGGDPLFKILFILVAFGAVAVYLLTLSSGPIDEFQESDVRTEGTKQVAGVIVPDENVKPFLKSLMSMRVPVTLTRKYTGVDKWGALKKWKYPEYLLEEQGDKVLSAPVKKSVNPVFLLKSTAKDKPLSDLPFTPTQENRSRLEAMRNYELIRNMTLATFLESTHKNTGYYHYYSGRASSTLTETLYQDIMPTEAFHVGDLDMTEVMIWMAHEGVTANTHYDRSHNFFVQVVGQKKWTLYPPSAFFQLYMYPHHHVHYHQTQVDYEEPNPSIYPNFALADPFEVILAPGDILYIPPYWFHRVEALTFSTSISIVSPSEEEQIYNLAYWMPVFLSHDWPPETQILAVTEYVSQLLRKCYSDVAANTVDEGAMLGHLLLLDRWRAFPLNTLEISDCSHTLVSFVRRLHREKRSSPTAPFSIVDHDEILGQIDEITTKMANEINRLPGGTRDINLANLLEEISSWLVSPRHIKDYLYYCFPSMSPLFPNPDIYSF